MAVTKKEVENWIREEEGWQKTVKQFQTNMPRFLKLRKIIMTRKNEALETYAKSHEILQSFPKLEQREAAQKDMKRQTEIIKRLAEREKKFIRIIDENLGWAIKVLEETRKKFKKLNAKKEIIIIIEAMIELFHFYFIKMRKIKKRVAKEEAFLHQNGSDYEFERFQKAWKKEMKEEQLLPHNMNLSKMRSIRYMWAQKMNTLDKYKSRIVTGGLIGGLSTTAALIIWQLIANSQPTDLDISPELAIKLVCLGVGLIGGLIMVGMVSMEIEEGPDFNQEQLKANS